VIECPYEGDAELAKRYLTDAMRDALHRGEAPISSATLWTTPGLVDPREVGTRHLVDEATFSWRGVADATVVYADLGVTPGMRRGIDHARMRGDCIEFRYLGGQWRLR
jgi:hypothetical protein